MGGKRRKKWVDVEYIQQREWDGMKEYELLSYEISPERKENQGKGYDTAAPLNCHGSVGCQ